MQASTAPAKLLCSTVVVIASCALLPGCLLIGGSKTVTEAPAPHSATLGQQLVDLGAARDMGVLTQAEFEIEKAKLLQGSGNGVSACAITVEGCKLPEAHSADAASHSVTAEVTITPSDEKTGEPK